MTSSTTAPGCRPAMAAVIHSGVTSSHRFGIRGVLAMLLLVLLPVGSRRRSWATISQCTLTPGSARGDRAARRRPGPRGGLARVRAHGRRRPHRVGGRGHQGRAPRDRRPLPGPRHRGPPQRAPRCRPLLPVGQPRQAVGGDRPRSTPTGAASSPGSSRGGRLPAPTCVPDARRRLRIDVDDVRADNPSVDLRAGHRLRCPRARRRPGRLRHRRVLGARAACSTCSHRPTASWPPPPRPAFGDVVGGLTIAGAISAALYQRATTGEPSVIDASLLASGMWQVQPDIVNAALGDEARPVRPPRTGTRPGTR